MVTRQPGTDDLGRRGSEAPKKAPRRKAKTTRMFLVPPGWANAISVEPGKGFAKGLELARRIAENAPLTNFAVTQALPRIAEMDPGSGYVMEALVASIAQADPQAKARLKDFLEKRGPKVTRG